MTKPKDGIKILSDSRHWLGWLISGIAITSALVAYVYYTQQAFDLQMTLITFAIVFVIEVLVDLIKHLVNLQ